MKADKLCLEPGCAQPAKKKFCSPGHANRYRKREQRRRIAEAKLFAAICSEEGAQLLGRVVDLDDLRSRYAEITAELDHAPTAYKIRSSTVGAFRLHGDHGEEFAVVDSWVEAGTEGPADIIESRLDDENRTASWARKVGKFSDIDRHDHGDEATTVIRRGTVHHIDNHSDRPEPSFTPTDLPPIGKPRKNIPGVDDAQRPAKNARSRKTVELTGSVVDVRQSEYRRLHLEGLWREVDVFGSENESETYRIVDADTLEPSEVVNAEVTVPR